MGKTVIYFSSFEDHVENNDYVGTFYGHHGWEPGQYCIIIKMKNDSLSSPAEITFKVIYETREYYTTGHDSNIKGMSAEQLNFFLVHLFRITYNNRKNGLLSFNIQK